MKAMLSAFAAIFLIAVIAWFGLENAGFTAAKHNSGPDVRLDSK